MATDLLAHRPRTKKEKKRELLVTRPKILGVIGFFLWLLYDGGMLVRSSGNQVAQAKSEGRKKMKEKKRKRT